MGKHDGVYTNFYNPHLGVGSNNPANNMMELTRAMYANMLTELCVNRFEWKGLPDSVDPRFLELNLFWRALTVFFKDTEDQDSDRVGTDDYLALQAAGSGMPNAQDVPTHFVVTAPNMLINRTLKSGVDCVPIWANYMRRPEIDKVALYSTKLASLDRTIEINSENMRQTKMVAVPENKRLSVIQMLQQHAQGQPAVMGTADMANIMENINVFDIGANPETLPKLLDAKTKMWNECMTMLGINNSNQEKRERLVAAEVGANDDQVASTQYIALNARQYAADQINDLYGLNVSVDFRVNGSEELIDEEDETGNEAPTLGAVA